MIQGRSARGPRRACGVRRLPAEAAIHLVEVLRHRGEALFFGAGARFTAAALAQRVVLDEPRDRRSGELGLLEDAGRIGKHCAGGRRLESESCRAGRGGHDDRRLGEDRRAGLRPATGADVHPVTQHEWDSGAGSTAASSGRARRPSREGRATSEAQHVRPGSEPEWSSIATSFRFSPGLNNSVSTPGDTRR